MSRQDKYGGWYSNYSGLSRKITRRRSKSRNVMWGMQSTCMTANPVRTAGGDPNPVSDNATAPPLNHGYSPIYSIGHSTRTAAQLVQILRRQDARTLVRHPQLPGLCS